MSHHLVVFALFCRNLGLNITEAVTYLGDNYDNLDADIVNAYEETYQELMTFVRSENA